jgi:hypothetical protein
MATARMPVVDERDAVTQPSVVVQLAGCHGADAIRAGIDVVTAGVRAMGADLPLVIICNDAAGLSDTGEVAGATATVVPCSFPTVERFPVITPLPHDAYRTVFSTARSRGARAIAVIGSEAEHLTPGLVTALVQPVLDDGFDVVAPRYVREVFDGLLNAAVVYPLTRALYGRRIQGQIGTDFGFSVRMAARWDGDSPEATRVTRPTWILPQAVCDDFRIAEAHLDVRLPPAPEASDLAGAFSQVIGSLFLDLEQRAPYWQRVSRSVPVPVIGRPTPAPATHQPVDVRPMIESFSLAYRNLHDVWTLLLSPATLVELKRLTMAAPEQFRMPDEVWARIVFDFAVGHRVRAINRDHLLRALVPAYLAWVASYANEMQGRSGAVADQRLERLCLAFEAEKPYLVRRWRWPDRFNP